jgi:hypothetical protein
MSDFGQVSPLAKTLNNGVLAGRQINAADEVQTFKLSLRKEELGFLQRSLGYGDHSIEGVG